MQLENYLWKLEVTQIDQSESSFWCRRLLIRQRVDMSKFWNVFDDSPGLPRLIPDVDVSLRAHKMTGKKVVIQT